MEPDNYYMSMAFLTAKRSKDPKTQVGACIVNEDNKIVGMGYNGMPNGCNFTWIKKLKLLYVTHAELNAIVNKNCPDLKNCRIYVSLFPCQDCAIKIIEAGIKEVIYKSDKHSDKESTMNSRKMLTAAKINLRQVLPKEIKINFNGDNDDANPSPAKQLKTC